MMKDFMKKILNTSWLEKIRKGAQEPKNKTFRRSHVPFRLNFLFFIIFTLFVALIARLGYLQIVNGEEMEARVKSTSGAIWGRGTHSVCQRICCYCGSKCQYSDAFIRLSPVTEYYL